jgi:predicted nucleic acid-binding protein
MPMPLEMPDGAACFVDANILYYHFVETPPFSNACTALLESVAIGRIIGYTAIHVISEAIHKVMLAEAAAKFGLDRAGLVNWLQRHRDRITELSEFHQAARELAIWVSPFCRSICRSLSKPLPNPRSSDRSPTMQWW